MNRRIVLLALFLALAHGPLFAEKIYLSNALGMPIQEIHDYGKDEFRYVLKVSDEEGIVVRTLLRDQIEYKRWELTYEDGYLQREMLYVEGRLSEAREYGGGNLLRERFFNGESVSETRTYLYSEGELREVRAVDQNGKLLYSDVYDRSPAGRLRRISRDSSEDKESSSFTYSQGGLVEEWHGKDGDGILLRYRDGERLAEEIWEGLKVRLAEEVKRVEGKKEIVKEDTEQNVTTTRYFDKEDRIQIERTETEDDLLEHIQYDYEEEKVTERTRVTPTAKEDIHYDYDESDRLVRETLYLNDRIVKVTEHTGTNSYIETVYREGKPTLRVRYEDGKKVGEEFLGAQVE